MDATIKSKLRLISENLGRKRITRFSFPYDKKEVFECIYYVGKMFVSNFAIDEYNSPAFENLVKYYFSDSTFPGDLYGGILLRGLPRTGKTLGLMIMNKIAQIYDLYYSIDGQKQSFQFYIEDAGDIARKYEDKGNVALKNGQTKQLYCIDDLGFENNFVKHYSNDCNVVREIITIRDLARKTHGFITAATTNYMYEIEGKKVFAELYGERVELRMKGLMTEIAFKGKPRV